MSLKQLIKQQKILSNAIDAELVLPGEPLIYSIKYPVGNRTRSTQFFRNAKWKSLLKSFFRSYYKTNVPVVVVVRFYVSPPESVHISSKDLRKESVPAVHSYEVCDYLLSFLEMLHHVLINSYRQVVKVEVDKFYSSDPRTVFKFIKWDEYVKFQNKHTIHSKSESVSEDREVRPLQSELQGDAPNKDSRKRSDKGEGLPALVRTLTSDSSLQNSSPIKPLWEKKKTAKFPSSYQEARRGQLREVPK